MATHMFMQIDDIQGESIDNDYSNQIEITGWNWGASNTGSASSGQGAGTGKVSATDLTYTANVDRSIPTVLSYLCAGKHFNTATLTICKAGGGKSLPYLTITLTTGVVSNVTFSGTPSQEVQTVTVSLHFAQVNVTYTPQNNDGSAGASVSAGYNIPQSKPV
jgi:type VI secretion system secreted protein Hcp